MQCFKCGCPQPTNAEAARLGAIATLNKIEGELTALEKGLTRTGAATFPEDELRMSSFEQGWGAAFQQMRGKILEISKEHKKEEKAITI